MFVFCSPNFSFFPLLQRFLEEKISEIIMVVAKKKSSLDALSFQNGARGRVAL